ncbi:MAG: hypothetical protein JXR05_02665 [Flavobacteriaceae bacterium]
MSKKKKKEDYYAWKQHLDNTKEIKIYSLKRLDLLIISISGAGIFIIFETLREFKTNNIEIESSMIIFLSGLSLMLAIISNFFSQRTGYNANRYEEKYTNIQLRKIKGKDIDIFKEEKCNEKVKLYNKLTERLNVVSIGFMILGLILLTTFYYMFMFS